MTASKEQQHRAKKQQCAKNDTKLADKLTPSLILSKKKSNLTSPDKVTLICNNDKNDNKKVAMICGARAGDKG